MLKAAQQRIRELEAALEKMSLSVRFQLKPDNLIRFYTGFSSYQVLITTFFLSPTAEKIYSWSQMQRLRNKDSTEIDKLSKLLELANYTYLISLCFVCKRYALAH